MGVSSKKKLKFRFFTGLAEGLDDGCLREFALARRLICRLNDCVDVVKEVALGTADGHGGEPLIIRSEAEDGDAATGEAITDLGCQLYSACDPVIDEHLKIGGLIMCGACDFKFFGDGSWSKIL